MTKIEQTNHSKGRAGIWLGILIGLIGVGALTFYFFIYAPARPFAVPGSETFDKAASFAVESDVTAELEKRLQTNLQTKSGLISWFLQENQEKNIPGDRSLAYDATEQLLYGSWLAEQSSQANYNDWLKSFKTNFISPDGLIYIQRNAADVKQLTELVPTEPSAVSWPDTLLYLRVLAQGYAKWPSLELDKTEKTALSSLGMILGDQITADSQMVIPTAAPTIDPAERPQETTETQSAVNLPEESVIRLETLDLLTLRYLGSLDERFTARYNDALAIAQGGLISDTLPLYAATYYPDNQGYVRFEGNVPEINLEASLQVALHLAEVGALDPRTLSWLSEHLLNDGALYTAYHITQGQATNGEESIVGYALTARIARITGQEELYQKAVNRLVWHLATSQTSQVRGAIFRQLENDRIIMTAKDNIWALLAFS